MFAVGLISNSQKEATHKAFSRPDEQADILAFWAPFLSLHLGGPDTITAFAIEYNAFWLRHMVGFITQVLTAIVVINQSLPRNTLWLPSALIFVVGTIKYGERTRALFPADKNQFRKSMLREPDPGPNYAKIMAEYGRMKEANLPVQIELIPIPNKEFKIGRYRFKYNGHLEDFQVFTAAFHFFKIFKGLIVDRIFTSNELNDSRRFFYEIRPADAFSVLSAELNFMYEDLYTKARVVHTVFGYIVRFISWCAIVAALSTFHSLDKHDFRQIDIEITYCLLFGAICLDTIAIFMLVFSDWTVVSILMSRDTIWMHRIKEYFLSLLTYFLSLKRIKLPENGDRRRQVTPGLFRRWSGCIYRHNLIGYCSEELSRTKPVHYALIAVTKSFGIKDWYDWMTYVTNIPLTENLWDIIFNELKEKSDLVDNLETAMRIRLSRGSSAIEDNISNSKIRASLMHYIVDFDYDQSLIIWHIATELCYQAKDIEKNSYSEFSKCLSEYMIYLLIMRPTLISGMIGIGQTAFYDTCAEAKRFFNEISDTSVQVFCCEILRINTDVKPIHLKGNKTKSLLFDGCMLAKELKEWRKVEELKEDKDLKVDMWKVISKVWVELLSYTASHCKAYNHAAQLSKGGELITFVWLLMAHFGEINKGHMDRVPETRLIVGK